MKNFEEWLKENADYADINMTNHTLNDAIWTYNLLSYQRRYEEYKESQPPTVRPMSELPKSKGQCATYLFVYRPIPSNSSKEERYVTLCQIGLGCLSNWDHTFRDTPPYECLHDKYKLIGWLYELPNLDNLQKA